MSGRAGAPGPGPREGEDGQLGAWFRAHRTRSRSVSSSPIRSAAESSTSTPHSRPSRPCETKLEVSWVDISAPNTPSTTSATPSHCVGRCPVERASARKATR